MKIIFESEYSIEAADSREKYEGLRALWSDTFGDPPEYVDAVYSCFGGEVKGYVVLDEGGRVCSALTLYPCGSFEGMPVYVSYSICTAEHSRGRGLAGALTTFVRDMVTENGGLSIVSPAEASLAGYYEKLGYEPFFFASKLAAMSPDFDDEEYDDFEDFGEGLDYNGSGRSGEVFDDEDFEAFEPAFDMKELDPAAYNRYREAFLSARPHVELSPDMLDFLKTDGTVFYAVNKGDAICAVDEAGYGRCMMSELILNPVLEEISSDIGAEIAALIAQHYGDVEAVYSTPGPGRIQAMAAGPASQGDVQTPADGFPDEDSEDETGYMMKEPYFGFPVA